MKKFGSFALAALIVTALGVSASATDFIAASGTATIDGKPDDAYKAADEVKINVVTSGDGKTTGTARVIWDNKNVYVFFDITDPVLSERYSEKNCYETDSVEFFIDLSGQPAGAKVADINAGQYTAPAAIPGASSEWSGLGGHWNKNKANATWKSLKTDKGYTLEMQIPWGSDYTPKSDAKVPVVFHINSDENGKDGREGEIFAGKDQGNAWSTTANYDAIVLSSKKYEAPQKPTAPVTADLGTVAAAASLVSGAAAVSLKKRK